MPLRTGSGALPKESGTSGDSPAFGVLRTLVLSHPLPGTAQHGSAQLGPTRGRAAPGRAPRRGGDTPGGGGG